MLDLATVRRSEIGQLSGDVEDSLDVGECEEASLAIPGDIRVFACSKAPAQGVRADIEKWGQIPGAVMPFIRYSKPIQFGW